MSEYTIYQMPGWHGEPENPIILETDDEHEARLWAGLRLDHRMPGASNRYPYYACDKNGREVERLDAYRCADCGEMIPWGDDGPVGMMGGEVLECPQSVETHLVSWVCEKCAYAD